MSGDTSYNHVTPESKSGIDTRILDMLPVAVAVISHDGRIIDANLRWKTFYRRSDVKGARYRTIGGALPDSMEHSFENMADSLERFLASGQSKMEIEYPCADGSWIMTVFTPTPSGCLMMHTDITTAKMNELALAEERTQIAVRLKTERERFMSLFDNMQSGVVIYRAIDDGDDFEIVDFNRAAENLERIDRRDVINRRVSEVFPGVREFGLLDVLMRVYQSGIPVAHPVTRYMDDRIEGWRDNVVFRLDSHEVVTVYSDVTRQRRVEHEMKRTQELFTQFMDNSELVHWIRSFDDKRIIYVNRAYAEVWGRPVSELYEDAKAFIRGIHPEDRDRVVSAIFGSEDGHFREEFRIIRPDATVRWILARAFPVRDDEGELYRVIGVAEDITERKNAEALLGEREQILNAMLNSSTDSMFLVAPDGTVLMLNDIAAERLGRSVEDILSVDVFSLFPPDVSANRRKHFDRVLETGVSERFEDERMGRMFDIQMYPVSPTNNGSGITAVAVYAREITRERQAEEHLRLAQKAFENSGEAILVTDVEGVILDTNPAFTRITGHDRKDALGQTPRVLKSGVHDDAFYAEMWSTLLKTGSWQGEVWDKRKNGEVYPKMLSITSARDEEGQISHFIAIFNDITRAKQTEQHLQRLAHFDTLTGLPNRLLFSDRLDQAINHAERYGEMTGLMFIDLDRFKIINDTLGHRAGDELLTQVAERLSGVVRQTDTVARLGGDEFTVLITDATGMTTLSRAATKLLSTFEDPFEIDGQEVFVTPSIGITVYPHDGLEPEQLLKNADAAMYRAKDLGRNMFIFYADTMHEDALSRLHMETELRHALDREELVVHYQPIVDSRTGRILSVEALLRWQHPTLGLVRPDRFIPIAEETGLISAFGRWITLQAATDIVGLNRRFGTNIRVAVNVSARQIQQGDFPEQLGIILTAVPGATEIMTLELTESTVMDSVQSNIDTLNELRNLGLKISIDDFGTGYSSLSYIKRLPLDCIKIDRSFIMNLPNDAEDVAIARAINAMAGAMNLSVTAEGVETAEQLEFLRDEGVQTIQGYYFSRPVPLMELQAILEKGETITPG